jgi:hypothetical protein
MKSTIQTALWIGAFILVAFIIVAGKRLSNPKLAISYLSQTNDAGHYMAFFVITNVGNVTVSSYSSGSVEIFGQDKIERVSCETKLPRLEPGGADIVTVFLPAAVWSRWRFTIVFSREGSGYRYGPTRYFSTSDWIK